MGRIGLTTSNVTLHISTQFQRDFPESKRDKGEPMGSIGTKVPPKSNYTSSMSSKEIPGNYHSLVNSWLELYQSSPKAIMHIYADVARGLTGCTRVTGVNSLVELVYTTSNVILRIFTVFKEIFLPVKELFR